MNQDYKKEEFDLSNEDKEKSITPPDDTGSDGGKPKPDPDGKTTQEEDPEEIDD